MTKRVRVPGRKVRSSQDGIFLNIEKPRIPVAAELGLDVDVVDDLGREEMAVAQVVDVALGLCARARRKFRSSRESAPA